MLAAFAGVPLLVALSPQDVPRLGDAALDCDRCSASPCFATLVATAATALAPVLAVRYRSFREALAGSSRTPGVGTQPAARDARRRRGRARAHAAGRRRPAGAELRGAARRAAGLRRQRTSSRWRRSRRRTDTRRPPSSAATRRARRARACSPRRRVGRRRHAAAALGDGRHGLAVHGRGPVAEGRRAQPARQLRDGHARTTSA